MTIRKKYSKEFKLDAISLVLEQGYSRAEASRSLSINPNVLTRWIKEHESEDAQLEMFWTIWTLAFTRNRWHFTIANRAYKNG